MTLYRNIEFSLILKSDKTISVTESTSLAPFDNLATYEKGDLFSIVVNSEGRVNFIQNGEQIFTSKEIVKFPLRIMASLDNLYNSISEIVYVTENGAFEQPPKEILPGQPVYWKHVTGAKAKPGYLRKTLLTDQYNSGSFSINSISDSSLIGGMTFKSGNDNKELIVGLSSSSFHTDPNEIDFAIKLLNGAVTILEKGLVRGTFKKYTMNDRFDIVLSSDSKQIMYFQNGNLFYTSSVRAPKLPLSVDNSLKSVDSCIFDIMWMSRYVFNEKDPSPGSFIYFKNVVGLDVSNVPGRIVKIINTMKSLDTNAFSTVGIQKQKPFESNSTNLQPFGFSFIISSKSNMMIGLSNLDNQTPDYSFRFYETGSVSIFEKGQEVATLKVKYEIGDKFAIYISNNVVYYSYNGNEFYSSKKVPIYPLGVDVNIGDFGASVEKVMFISNERPIPQTVAIGQPVYWAFEQDAFVSPVGGFVYRYSEFHAYTTSKLFIDTQQAITKYDMVGGVSWKTSGQEGYLGLSETSEITSTVGINYCIYTGPNGLLSIYEKGNFIGNFHYFTKGDELSIRVSTNHDLTKQIVVYLHNGNIFYSSQLKESIVLPNKLFVSVVLVTPKSSYYDVTWVSSFKPEELEEEKPISGTPIKRFTTVVGVERLQREILSISRSIIRKIRIGANNDAGFVTSRKYLVDGSIVKGFSFKTLFNTYGIQIGFTSTNSYAVSDLRVALSLRSDKQFNIVDNNKDIPLYMPYKEHDEFSMILLETGRKNERTLAVLLNGEIVYSDTRRVYTGSFGVAANCINNGVSIYDLIYIDSNKIPTSLDKSNKGGSLISWNNVQFAACKDGEGRRFNGIFNTWNSGIISQYAFYKEDSISGFSFIASQPDGQIMAIGLNNDPDYNFHFNLIDYAIYLEYNQVQVYENGVKMSTLPSNISFKKGDLFEIKIVEGVVQFLKEGNVFYKSKAVPTFPLKVQASFHSALAQVAQVKWIQ